jgi:MGT family glycosyltransferase
VIRVLFVSLPLAGHVYPASAIAAELTARGHEVAWAGAESSLRPLLGPDATILRVGTRLFREQGGAGIASIRSLWTRFIVPYAKFLLPGVERVVLEFRPDVLVVDQHAVAGALVARRHGLPWATLVCSAMELTEPHRALPKLAEWTRGHLVALWTAAGLPPEDFADPRYSPDLVLAQTTTALVGDLDRDVRLVGPLVGARPEPSFDVTRLDPDRAHVLVSMGTLADDLATGFLARTVAALRSLDVQAIVVAPEGQLPDPPPNVIVAPRVPMLTLLPHIDVLVGHGGVNTTCEALAHGIPVVLAPIRHDQPELARQVVAAGAGLRVRFRRSGPDELAAAIGTVLTDPAYRTAARRIAASFRAAGGAAEAAAQVERLQKTVSERRRSLSHAATTP